MEKLHDLQYTVSILMSEDTMKKHHGGGASKNRLEAVLDAFTWFAKTTLGYSKDAAVRNRLNELYPKIKEKMENHSGVLVIVQYQKWKYADPGNNPPQLLSVHIGPAASNRHSAFRKWKQLQKMPQLKPGPDDGMVFGPTEMIWFTRVKSKDADQKELNEKQEIQYWKPAS